MLLRLPGLVASLVFFFTLPALGGAEPCPLRFAQIQAGPQNQAWVANQVRAQTDGSFQVLVPAHEGEILRVIRARDLVDAISKVENSRPKLDLAAIIASRTGDHQHLQPLLSSLSASFPGSRFYSRVKEISSLKNKLFDQALRKGSASPSQIKDLVGGRLVLASASDLAEAQSRLVKKFGDQLVDAGSLPQNRGYRAVHVVARGPSGGLVEIQVMTERTERAMTWSHDRIYKYTERLTPDYHDRLLRYGLEVYDYLNALDQGMTPLRRPNSQGIKTEDLFPEGGLR
jgi:ppGpp synthetase/RelA/SpoT-type nucleotidyltranferase